MALAVIKKLLYAAVALFAGAVGELLPAAEEAEFADDVDPDEFAEVSSSAVLEINYSDSFSVYRYQVSGSCTWNCKCPSDKMTTSKQPSSSRSSASRILGWPRRAPPSPSVTLQIPSSTNDVRNIIELRDEQLYQHRRLLDAQIAEKYKNEAAWACKDQCGVHGDSGVQDLRGLLQDEPVFQLKHELLAKLFPQEKE